MSIGENLTTKLGPLPVWSWGVLAGVGIVGGKALYGKLRPSTAPASDAAPTTGPAGEAAPAASSVPATSSEAGSFMAAGTYVPSGAYTVPTTESSASSLKPTDNDEWARTAITLVVAQNTALGTIEVTEAIRAYVDGRAVTDKQAAIIELGLRAVGSPPYPVPPINVVNPTPIVVTNPSAPPAPTPAATSPVPAAWSPPASWGGAKFVRGNAGPAVYLVTAGGLEWIPSEDALVRLAGTKDPWPQVLVIPSANLRGIPRIGTVPDQAADPSL